MAWEGDEWAVLFAPEAGDGEDTGTPPDLGRTLPEYFLVFVSRQGQARRIGEMDRGKAVRAAKRIAGPRGWTRASVVAAAFLDGSWLVRLEDRSPWGSSDMVTQPVRLSTSELTVIIHAGGVVSIIGGR